VTFTTTTLSSGQHSITAVYGGDGNFAGSSSNPVVQTVNDIIPTTIATTTAISPTSAAVYGQTVSFSASVSPVSGSATPTGTVQFVLDGSNFGAPVPLVNGSAVRASISTLSVGDHTVAAIYSGDPAFAA